MEFFIYNQVNRVPSLYLLLATIMTEQTIFSLLAACFGFISAMFFGFGSAFTSQTKMVALSKMYWDYNKEYADATVSQSTQYLIGAVLLIVSFGLQVKATLASTAIFQASCLVLTNPLLFVFCAVLSIGIPAFFVCRLLTKWRQEKVISQLQKEVS